MHPQLGVPVVVDVALVAGERFALTQHALGDGELAPDRIAQMRQVKTAEHAMPVGVVALRPPNGPPRLGRFASAYLTRKWCQCPPRTNAVEAARRSGPSSSSSLVRSCWAAGGRDHFSISR